jgi:uncharacterized membrane protein YeaQ/YmgE (transglycosylase-associated protein family)
VPAALPLETACLFPTMGVNNPAVRFNGPRRGTPYLPPQPEVEMTASGIITAIIVGAIIGALGRLVVPGRQNMPIWLTIVVGIVAALIGTFIAGALNVKDTSGFDWIEFFIQVALAAIGVALVAGMYGRRRIT